MKARIAICMIAAMLFGVLYAADEELVPVVDFSISETPREAKMEEMTVAGFQVMNTMEHDAMMKVWGDFMSVVGKLPCDPSAPYYGVNFFTKDYNPQDHTGFGYMACAPVLNTEKLPEGVVARKTPLAVAISEAMELAKQYGTEDSGRFVNGVLGKIVRAQESPSGEEP